jgi:hypothetical protein
MVVCAPTSGFAIAQRLGGGEDDRGLVVCKPSGGLTVERRSFVIVGAGQSGLQLGIGLLDDGHDVTVVTNRTQEEVRNGRLLSGQTMFGAALATERALGIDLWQQECPQIDGMAFALFPPGDPTPVFDWGARLDAPGQSVDQRVKYPAWMDLLEQRGGHLEIAQNPVRPGS